MQDAVKAKRKHAIHSYVYKTEYEQTYCTIHVWLCIAEPASAASARKAQPQDVQGDMKYTYIYIYIQEHQQLSTMGRRNLRRVHAVSPCIHIMHS